MLIWTVAKIKDPANEGMWLPESYYRYVIKLNGEIIATVQSKYRPKNAGGTAWEALAEFGEFGGRVGMFSKNRKRVMEDFRQAVIGNPRRFGVEHLFPAKAA
jgi:hypothetical protein